MTKETQTKYTVFAECEGLNGSTYETFENNLDNTYHDGSIEGVINFLVEEGYTPVAWAAELTHGYTGSKTVDGLRAESIAAGRLIELVDGKYVARGVAAEEEPAKSIGALIREQQQVKAGEPIGDDYDEGDEGWDSIAPNPYEPKRAPLDWNKPVPFNNFDGFKVSSNVEVAEGRSSKHPLSLSPDMADSSHQANPAFGSAALLKD
jgi:hypothetical protein